MKIAYGSDFHFEFYDHRIAKNIIKSWSFDKDTDFIVIAGDLHVEADNVINYLNYIYDTHGIYILYVPGNHEYYHSSFEKENIFFMDNGLENSRYSILLEGKKLINELLVCGCMGNLDESYQPINIRTHGNLNDFHMISDFSTRVDRGSYEKLRLEYFLKKEKYTKSIIITHTMPSPKCISKKYEGDYLNACFANDWEDIMYKYEPNYWICGHTHDVSSLKIHNTDILINPLGYPRENTNWEWRYINV